MSTSETGASGPDLKRRIRNGALGLGSVAVALYIAFIALLVYRSHH